MKKFEWSDSKSSANFQKHGIDFQQAAKVFSDVRAFTYVSSVASGEERLVTIGQLDGRLVAVVHVRRNDKTRIISARRARKNERAWYG